MAAAEAQEKVDSKKKSVFSLLLSSGGQAKYRFRVRIDPNVYAFAPLARTIS